jgi:hypothetical protein
MVWKCLRFRVHALRFRFGGAGQEQGIVDAPAGEAAAFGCFFYGGEYTSESGETGVKRWVPN